jgi:protein-S-isoprenylcysteine O-methyltransferase Ste14
MVTGLLPRPAGVLGLTGGPTSVSANLLVIALVIFVLCDYGVVRVATGQWQRQRSADDRSTYLVVQIAQIAGLGLALGARSWAPGLNIERGIWVFVVAGLAFLVAGTAVRVWAVLTLGRFFNREVMVRDDHRVITDGPYRWVRHPSYSGALLAFFGFGVGQCNWLSLGASLVLPVAGYLYRIRSEEQTLLAGLGEPYRMYMDGHKRLIPGVF